MIICLEKKSAKRITQKKKSNYLSLSVKKIASEAVEVYLEKESVLNKDYFYQQCDPAKAIPVSL